MRMMYVLENEKIRVEYPGSGRVTIDDFQFSGVWMRFLLEAKGIFRSVGILSDLHDERDVGREV